MSLHPGQVFAGRYRIERKLGEGGMGEVFAARHLELGELVALKVLLADVTGTEATARFHREARAASQLRGEHVVRTLDAARLEDGTPYMVLEYIDGPDLAIVGQERAPLPINEALELIVQACEGVAEAHALGMVHRDLKLKNMLLTKRPDGSALLKILDFGVVKLTAESEATQSSLTLTQVNALIGSAHYMAPEQIQMSSKVDARADVWSLGVCLYTLLTAKRPFNGKTMADIFTAIGARHPKSVRERRPDVPEEISDAIGRALEKNLNRRFQNVAELAGSLGPHIGDPDAGDRIEAVLRAPRRANERVTPPTFGVVSLEDDVTTSAAAARRDPETLTVALNIPPSPSPRDSETVVTRVVSELASEAPTDEGLSDASLSDASTARLPARPVQLPVPAMYMPTSPLPRAASLRGPAPPHPPVFEVQAADVVVSTSGVLTAQHPKMVWITFGLGALLLAAIIVVVVQVGRQRDAVSEPTGTATAITATTAEPPSVTAMPSTIIPAASDEAVTAPPLLTGTRPQAKVVTALGSSAKAREAKPAPTEHPAEKPHPKSPAAAASSAPRDVYDKF